MDWAELANAFLVESNYPDYKEHRLKFLRDALMSAKNAAHRLISGS